MSLSSPSETKRTSHSTSLGSEEERTTDPPLYSLPLPHINTFLTANLTKSKEDTNVRFLKIATVLRLRFKNPKYLLKSERAKMFSKVLKEQYSNVETTESEKENQASADSDDENVYALVCIDLDHYRAGPVISMMKSMFSGMVVEA